MSKLNKILLTSSFILINYGVHADTSHFNELQESNPYSSIRAPHPSGLSPRFSENSENFPWICKGNKKNVSHDDILSEITEDESVKLSTQTSLSSTDLDSGEVSTFTAPSNSEPLLAEEDLHLTRSHALGTKDTKEITLSEDNLFVPKSLGKLAVTYKDNEFFVSNGKEKIQIQRWNLSQELRGIKEDQLKGFLKVGYLSLKQQDDNKFSLNANFRLRGGGGIADGMEMGRGGTRVAEGVGGAAGAAGGAWLGGVIGGAIGSLFGPGGAVTGAWIGKAIGGAIGAGAGTAIAKTN
ncbi:MAG: hypothetical protein K2X28_06815 [Alphaproteobacteria bacterium]|nr:hypothetical protein [Alphaproteobacteria bacterium]